MESKHKLSINQWALEDRPRGEDDGERSSRIE